MNTLYNNMRKTIGFYPYKPFDDDYCGMMQGFLSQKYRIIDYTHIRDGVISVNEISCIYLNWLEGYMQDSDFAILREAKKSGTKIVWVFHNKAPHDLDIKETIILQIKFLIEISDLIILHSKNSKKYLDSYTTGYNNNKVYYIPHPDFMDIYYRGVNLRDKFGLGDNFVYLIQGNLAHYKNLELLIDIFKDLNKEISDISLIIAGREDQVGYADMLRERAGNDSIIIVNKRISSIEMGSFLEACDVMVLPYAYESSMNSGVMIMSFSYGKTVIIPDISMADDFDEQLIYKYHYDNDLDHRKKLYDEMLRAFKDGRNTVRNKGEELREIIKQYYSKEYVRQELLMLVSNKMNDRIMDNTIYENVYGYFSLSNSKDAAAYRALTAFSWKQFVQNGGSFHVILEVNEIKQVAVYGYGILGKELVNDLKREGIKVSFLIDKKGSSINADIPIYTLEKLDSSILTDEFINEGVIISTVFDFNSVRNALWQRGVLRVISLNELLRSEVMI